MSTCGLLYQGVRSINISSLACRVYEKHHHRIKSKLVDDVLPNKMTYEESEDTKGVIRIRISKKNRQHNGHKKKDKQRSTKHTYKTKDRVPGTPLNTWSELGCSGRSIKKRFAILAKHLYIT